MGLFLFFAAFPRQLLTVPTALFDALAKAKPDLFHVAPSAKRPHLRVRSWLTALQRLGLLQGSIAEGFCMHDMHVCAPGASHLCAPQPLWQL